MLSEIGYEKIATFKLRNLNLFLHKACSTLAKDRFKSLEKRGLIAPTGKTRRLVESLLHGLCFRVMLLFVNPSIDGLLFMFVSGF